VSALRRLLPAVALVAVLAPAPTVARATRSLLPSNRPNILLVISDDQAYSTWSRDLMPQVFSQLVDKGASFDRGYVSTSLCCPSRAEIFTGLYEHHTGVDQNSVSLVRPTIAQAVHDLGYRTMLAGKYLNSWPCNPRPEFDEWWCRGTRGKPYVNPTINVNGQWTLLPGYTTDILAGAVTDFIASTPQDQPFFAVYAPFSPHLPANDPRCADIPVAPFRPPSFDEDVVAGGKPAYLPTAPLTSAEIAAIDSDFRMMTQAVQCLDGSVGSLLGSLGDREDDTLVIYLSDNGYLYGEHRLRSKGVPYQEAVRVPFVVRYPPLAPPDAPFSTGALVENVDIAPTIADLLGIHWGADGISLVPLLTGEASSIRDAALLSRCQGVNYPCGGSIGHFPSSWGLVTDQEAYVEYPTGELELYDLSADPFELTNLSTDPNHNGRRNQLGADLAALRAPPPTDTTIVTGPVGPLAARRAAFTFFSQSRLATYACRLDRDGVPGAWEACDQGTFTVQNLADGDYTFQVAGTADGDTDASPDTRSFSIHTIGPDVSIDAAPAPHLRDTTVGFSFSSQTPGVTFECSLGAVGGPADWQPCDQSAGATYGPLADGRYLFQVRATDEAGTTGDPPGEWVFQVDNAGPTLILDSVPVPHYTRSTSAGFAFHPDEPVDGPIGCSLDAAPPVDCSDGSFAASGLGEGPHALDGTAADELGNTATTRFAWTVDLTAPVVTIVDGPPSRSNVATATFHLSYSEPGVHLCRLDKARFVGCGTTVSFTGLDDGLHKFTAKTTDQAGNKSGLATRSWRQDTVAPVVTFLSAPPDPSNLTTASFTYTGGERVTFSCSRDGGGWSTCGSSRSYKSLKPGLHSFSVKAVDLAGNESAPATHQWTIDTTAPTATIASGPADPTTETAATFDFSSTEPGTFACSLDGDAPSACSTGVSYSDLSEGPHTFAVTATDVAGNESDPATWFWTVEPPPPPPGQLR
jgi:arylsulfatase A-like enzyme